MSHIDVHEIKLNLRYPNSRQEDITDAFMRGYQGAVKIGNDAVRRVKAEKAALERRIDELCQENEALRLELAIREKSEQEKVIDYLGKECVDWEDKYLALAGDNAKLRKLVDGITFCSTTSSRSDDCIGCPLLNQSTHNYRCTKTECMRDLGIEVE